MINTQCLTQIRRDIAMNGNAVTIVAASKTRPIEELKQLAVTDGDIIFGENRVQELLDKYDPSLRWHFIGRLQTNKVKYIVGKVELIHSLDRRELAAEIDRQAAKRGIVQDCLVEVNVGGEEEKGGVAPSELDDFLGAIGGFAHIRVTGLMTVMPNIPAGEELDALYERLKGIFDGAKARTYADNVSMRYLSAGMSNDYATALRHGANMIRIGRAIFGERNR